MIKKIELQVANYSSKAYLLFRRNHISMFLYNRKINMNLEEKIKTT